MFRPLHRCYTKNALVFSQSESSNFCMYIIITVMSRFCLSFSGFQLFNELHNEGTTKLTLNISDSCATCYNVRLLKVRNLSVKSVMSKFPLFASYSYRFHPEWISNYVLSFESRLTQIKDNMGIKVLTFRLSTTCFN